jgi:hypothetical protein
VRRSGGAGHRRLPWTGDALSAIERLLHFWSAGRGFAGAALLPRLGCAVLASVPPGQVPTCWVSA